MAKPCEPRFDHLERQIVFDTLERFGGNQGKAAEALGISRRTLLRKLKNYRENESEAAVGTFVLSSSATIANRPAPSFT